MAVTKLPADLFRPRKEKTKWNIFVPGESICQSAENDAKHLGDIIFVVQAGNKRSQNESNVWSIFADVHSAGRSEE
jgi:hypothetical protein